MGSRTLWQANPEENLTSGNPMFWPTSAGAAPKTSEATMGSSEILQASVSVHGAGVGTVPFSAFLQGLFWD